MREEIIEKVSVMVTGAFGLVAALAWNSAIQAMFARYYSPGQGITSQIIYAVTVTLIAVIVTIWIGRAAARARKRDKQIKDKLEEVDKKLKQLNKRK